MLWTCVNKIFYSHTFISLGSISGSAMTGASTLGIYLTLFNFLIFSSSFFVNSLGFDTQIIMLSVTKDRFTSSFPNCMIFVSFSCLIALARTLSTIFNTKWWESKFFPYSWNLKESIQSFAIKCIWCRFFVEERY